MADASGLRLKSFAGARMTVRVRVTRRFRWRMRVGLWIMALGVRITGASFQVKREEGRSDD